jgi:hypothetical protein
MNDKLTAVEWLAEKLFSKNRTEFKSDLIAEAKEIENEQTIKAAARGFLAMPEKFNLNNAKEFAEQYYKNTYE